MDNDDEPMDAPYQAPPRKTVTVRENVDHTSSKRIAIPAPEQAAVDVARNDERYWKEMSAEFRARVRTAEQENAALRNELKAAQGGLAHRQQEVQYLQQQIQEAVARIEKMNYDESGLHAQIMDDQERVSGLIQQVTTAQRQAAEASTHTYGLQEAINTRDTELGQLRAQVHKRDDEVNHLRLQLKASGRRKTETMPRRRGRVNVELLGTGQPSTIELPLDPAPLPAEGPAPLPTDTPPTRTPAVPAAVAENPVLKRFAAKLDVEVQDLVEAVQSIQIASVETGAQIVVSPQNTPQKNKQVRPDSKAARKEAVKPANQTLCNKAHALLRQTTYRKFKVEQSSDFIFHESATAQEVEEFSRDDNATLKHWQWDFNPGYLSSAWNVVQIERIIVETVKEDGKACRHVEKGEIQVEYLEIVLREQLERYRGDWNLFQPKWWDAQGRIETKAEAVARAKIVLFLRRLNSRNINAQNRKYLYRENTIEAVIALKAEEGANDIATWHRLLAVLRYLGAEGMSEEEEKANTLQGQKIKTYKIKLCVWRESTIAQYMNLVDAQRQRFEELHNGTKSAPRERVQENGKRPAPKGLPECLYNSRWLGSLAPKALKELEVSKDVFALFVAATDRMV
ncbi:hypothetical protein R3P38DRAFT_3292187 [Favolaschia claudopus]|uniref:Uncharacterized protein n=1 Tax=Favolaschia claudopus TaxID=2862362 RepID=A0AAV9ZKT0_9AGAR